MRASFITGKKGTKSTDHFPHFQKQDVDAHKKQLLKKAIENKKRREKNAEDRQTTQKGQVLSGDAKEEIKKLKKQLRNANQTSQRLQKEKVELRRKNQKQHNEISKLRKDRDNFDSKIKQIKAEYAGKEKELDQKINQKKVELGKIAATTDWLKSVNLSVGSDLQQHIENQEQQMELLSLLFNVVMKKNANLSERLTQEQEGRKNDKREIAKYENQNKQNIKNKVKLRSTVKTLISENDLLVKRLHDKYLLKHMPIPDLIQLLTERCSTKTIAEYDKLDTLIQRYYQAKEDNHQGKFSYGYLEEDDGQYLLHDINRNSVYPVAVSEEKHEKIASGIVVRCKYDNGAWVVDNSYPTMTIKSRSANTVKHTTNKGKSSNHVQNAREIVIANQQELDWLRKLNVVLVGNKYSDGFANEIKQYCHLKAFDAYEANPQQIFKAMHSADYVFLLIGSVPHTITEYTKSDAELNEDSDKVQIFDVPAKYDGVVRLHYLYANFAE